MSQLFGLFGVNKYGVSRLVCTVFAPSLKEAADKLGGTLLLPGDGKRQKFKAIFIPEAQCAIFRQSKRSADLVAAAWRKDGSKDAALAIQYDFNQVYLELLIGQIPCLR